MPDPFNPSREQQTVTDAYDPIRATASLRTAPASHGSNPPPAGYTVPEVRTSNDG